MADAIMKRERTRRPLNSMLRYQGEPTLRSLAEMCTRRAEALEQEAAIERDRARQYLEAADARAAEKRTKKESRIRMRRQTERKQV